MTFCESSLTKQNLRCCLCVVFVCGRLARGSLHHCCITGIAPKSSSLRVNYFIRAVTERERAECGHCACCCTGNDVRIGTKTYRIGHVIGANAFHLDAPTMGIYRSLTIKLGWSCLPSLIFFGILGESVKLEKMPSWGFQGQKW